MKRPILIVIAAGLLFSADSLAMQPAPPPPRQDQPAPPPPDDDRPPRDERPLRRGGDRPGEPGGPGGMGAVGRDPKLLREFVDRQLDQLTKATKRLEEAKAELAAGTPPEEVFRKLREARAGVMADNFFSNWRDRQPPGFQPNGANQPPGPPEREQIDELMKFVRDVRPEFADRLEKWRKDEPRAFMLVVSRLIHQARDTFRERDQDKQLFELRKDDLRNNVLIVEKAAQLRAMQGDKKEMPEDAQFLKAKSELRDLMERGYDSRVRVREYEATQLETRLKETREKIRETKEVRDRMIDRAVDEVLTRKRVSPQPGDGPGNQADGRPPKKSPPPDSAPR